MNSEIINSSSPSYYAVVPANVRYCKDLEPNAKLLYGEISALANKHGYCWATNNYFAELYDVDSRTIRRWLEALKTHNFIVCEIDDDNCNSQRKIYLTEAFQISFKGGQKCPTPGQKCPEGGGKNVHHNTTSNTKSNNPPPLTPQKVEPKHVASQKSLRSEEEDSFACLEGTTLSPKDKRRLTREYSEPEVIRALEISKSQVIKKSLMGMLIDILTKPDKWPDKPNETQVTPNQQIALNYNDLLAKMAPKTAEKNKTLILEDKILTYVSIPKEGYEQLSLKAPDFLEDIKKSTEMLRKKLGIPI